MRMTDGKAEIDVRRVVSVYAMKKEVGRTEASMS